MGGFKLHTTHMVVNTQKEDRCVKIMLVLGTSMTNKEMRSYLRNLLHLGYLMKILVFGMHLLLCQQRVDHMLGMKIPKLG